MPCRCTVNIKQHGHHNCKYLTFGSRNLAIGTVLSEELLKSLERPADVLLGNLCQGIDLSEGSGNTALAAGNEDTSGNDSFLRLALECLCVIDQLEQVLGDIGDVLWNGNGVTMSTDLLVCC